MHKKLVFLDFWNLSLFDLFCTFLCHVDWLREAVATTSLLSSYPILTGTGRQRRQMWRAYGQCKEWIPWLPLSGRGARWRSSEPCKATPKSPYRGVYWHGAGGKWASAISDPASRRRHHLGLFEDDREAASVFDAAGVILRGSSMPRNFTDAEPSDKELLQARLRLAPKTKASSFKGVMRTGRSAGRWGARVKVKGRAHYLGTFDNEREAAKAYDDALRSGSHGRTPRSHLLACLNFPEEADLFSEKSWRHEPVPPGKTSRFLGVRYDPRTKKFVAQAACMYLGSFATELEAARAFDAASRPMGGRTNFGPLPNTAACRCNLKKIDPCCCALCGLLFALMPFRACMPRGSLHF